MKPFAVFIFSEVGNGKWAATTRAADRGEGGKVGLPGGKVDPGEKPEDAVLREAQEEGWAIPKSRLIIVHEQKVDGRPVRWYYTPSKAKALTDYKEKHRMISPVEKTLDEIARSGYGNDNAVESLKKFLELDEEFLW